MPKRTGTSTGAIETSQRYRRKRARRRRAEEEAWAAKSGPVIVRMGDTEIYLDSERVKGDLAKARALLIGELENAGADDLRPT